jgi:hypothetical protein
LGELPAGRAEVPISAAAIMPSAGMTDSKMFFVIQPRARTGLRVHEHHTVGVTP